MSQTEDEVVQVHQIEATQDRLAGAVEALAYKKSHLKEEAIGAAQVQADRLLDKAEEKKDEVVAKLVDKLPSPDEVRQTARKLAGEVSEKVVGGATTVKDTAVAKVGDKLPAPVTEKTAERRWSAKVADAVANVKEAAASEVLADEGGT